MEKYHLFVESSDQSRIKAIYKSAPLPHRTTMLSMRKTILEIIPEAQEIVSYGMPAFKVDENIVAGLLHAKNHVGYYPFSGSILKLFPAELKKLSKTKSAIHVPVDKPLSKNLIKKLIQARISQCPVKTGKVKISKYGEVDGYWKTIGIAAPARRGLIDNKILTLSDLESWKENDLRKIHGMGPIAISIIKNQMRIQKINFKK